MTARVAFPANASGGVVIVGAGLAGLFTALKLAPLPVTVISAARFGEGASSLWAQGGIAAAVAEGDTAEAHAADTVAAGAGIVHEKIALLMAREARERIEDLLFYGCRSTRTSGGGLRSAARPRMGGAAFFTSKAIRRGAPSCMRSRKQ